MTGSHETGRITRDGARIVVVGHVGIPNCGELKQAILDAVDEGLVPIVDVRAAGYIDSIGHGVLILCAKRMHALKRGTLIICNANEELRNFLEASGLIRHFELHEDHA